MTASLCPRNCLGNNLNIRLIFIYLDVFGCASINFNLEGLKNMQMPQASLLDDENFGTQSFDREIHYHHCNKHGDFLMIGIK